MAISLFLLLLIVLGGLALTYVLSDEETLLWRLSAGCVIGSSIYGTLGLLIGSIAGLTAAASAAALALTLLPLLLFLDPRRRAIFRHDRAVAKGKSQGASRAKGLRFFYYLAFFLLFFFFFERAMIVNPQGIFTGGSNNLGDLPFHLGAIHSFTDGGNLPPQNPNFSGTKFSYPFIADLVTAMFVKLGAGAREAMFAQNLAWAFSLFVIFESFVRRLVHDRIAGRVAPILLFFSGGLGFVWFFTDFAAQERSFSEFFWNVPKDYTIGDEFRWGNSLTTLFLTQRSLLLGMPLTLAVLSRLWDRYTEAAASELPPAAPSLRSHLGFFVLGAVAGLLPLIHVHSLIVLFVFGVFLLVADAGKWRDWLAFAAGTAIVSIPELLWSTSGSATRVSEFIGWHFGWDSGETNFFWFWLKNTGAVIPLIAAGAYLIYRNATAETARAETEVKRPKKQHKLKIGETRTLTGIPHARHLLLFYIPFALLFIVSNTLKLAPWQWDNVKVLIYWFVGSIPLISYALAWAWRRGPAARAVSVLLLLSMTLAGAIDVWRTVSRQVNYQLFDADALTFANRIRATTPPGSLFLNAPTYNSPVLMTGRPSFMRYTGHLNSHGIDFGPREEIVKAIYRGGPEADELLRGHGIQYVIVTQEERGSLQANEAYFSKYPVTAEVGTYRLYKVQ